VGFLIYDMPVLVNFKICDNSRDCSGIEACPTGAFYWDEDNKTIAIDDSKCSACGVCEESCPVGAIRVAKNSKEYSRIKKEIDADTRTVSDLFIDRYGAEPKDPAFLISQDKFDIQILESVKMSVVELFDNDSIMCLLYSIPIRVLFEGMDIKYRKIRVKDDSLLGRYDVGKLPCLLFFRDGKIVGKIEGYFGIEKKKEILSKVTEIIS